MKKSLSWVLFGLALSACDHDSVPPPPTPTNNAALAATTTAASSQTSAATSAAGPTPSSATSPSPSSLAVGSPPPDFSAKASDGTALDLAALKGKPVVVYFYPKDETPGCTKEASSFRDAWEALKKKGVVMIGVSADNDESHKAFAAHHKLPFLLVSDDKGAIAQSFGVPFQNGYTARQTFVIGPDGNLKKIYRKVDVTVHAAEISKDVE